MGYINEILLIFRYSGEQLPKIILCAFEAELDKLYKLPIKAQKVIAYLK
jgi:hypothetical protein